MLPNCDDSTPLRIVGIDPGTETLGVSVLDVSLSAKQISLISSITYKGSSFIKEAPGFSRLHGDKFSRLLAHENNLKAVFSYWQPHEVISEAPYMGRFPAAYAALVECLMCIKRALLTYDAFLPLLTVDPPTAKNAVGVGGKNGDKNQMSLAIKDHVDRGVILNPNNIDIASLDEHSIDSIAIGYTRALFHLL